MKAYIVDSSDLNKNLRSLVKRASGTPIYAVLKGNGYGLGLLPMARACREAGIDRFALTEIDDIRTLRENGFLKEEILMLRATCDSEELRQLIDLDAVITVSSQDDATVLNGVALQMKTVANTHLKIDLGMGRYGFLPTDLDKILSIYAYMDGIAVSGIYAHLNCAFCDQKLTVSQGEQFAALLKTIQAAGYETGTAHLCNSAGFLRFPQYKFDAVRIGSALLGRLSLKGSYSLKRIGQCQATVDEVRWLPKGATCGYGAAWKAKKPTRIAVIPIGWYHGFGCEMGNDIFRPRDGLRMILKGIKTIMTRKAIYVTIGKSRCKVLGHIGMLHTVCDVTSTDCKVGDAAVLNINPTMMKGLEVVFQ